MISQDNIIGARLQTKTGVLVGDWIAIVFFVGVGVGLTALLWQNSSVSRVSYGALLLPLFFVLVTLKKLHVDNQVGRISLRAQGLEIAGRKGHVVVEWKSIQQTTEKHGYQPGLLLRLKTGNSVFIPVGIRNYKAVKAYVLQEVALSERGGS